MLDCVQRSVAWQRFDHTLCNIYCFYVCPFKSIAVEEILLKFYNFTKIEYEGIYENSAMQHYWNASFKYILAILVTHVRSQHRYRVNTVKITYTQ
jgi:hypothetical protein